MPVDHTQGATRKQAKRAWRKANPDKTLVKSDYIEGSSALGIRKYKIVWRPRKRRGPKRRKKAKK